VPTQIIDKGMILCAGLGTRMLPITEICPKPLVPILNIPNILYNIFLLRKAGIEKIMLNLYHLPEPLEKFLGDGSKWDVELSYSHEKVLLGTGGGVKKVEPFFEGNPFILCNCDFVVDLELGPIIERHFERKAIATMVLFEDEKLQPFYSKVGITSKEILCQLPSCQTAPPKRIGIFTGIHILNSEVLQHMRAEFSGINQILYPRLMKEYPQKTFGEFVDNARWKDTGDLNAFWMTSMELMKELIQENSKIRLILSDQGYFEKSQGIWLAEGATLPDEVDCTPPLVIGANCRIAKEVRLGPYVIVGDNCRIGKKTKIEETVLLPNSQVESNENLARTLVFGKSVLPAHRRTV